MAAPEMEEARRLPPGSHGIPVDIVARNQRERLIAAMAEVCAGRGYAEATVSAVAKRAGVSSVTFYKQFADKRVCVLAAHRQLLGRLLEEVDRAVEAEGSAEARTRTTIRTVLTLFAGDAPSARLLTIEILAAGPEGVKRHDAMVEAFAGRLRPGRGHDEASPRELAAASSPSAPDWVRVAGMLALIGRLVVAGEADRLHELEDELVATVSSQS